MHTPIQGWHQLKGCGCSWHGLYFNGQSPPPPPHSPTRIQDQPLGTRDALLGGASAATVRSSKLKFAIIILGVHI